MKRLVLFVFLLVACKKNSDQSAADLGGQLSKLGYGTWNLDSLRCYRESTGEQFWGSYFSNLTGSLVIQGGNATLSVDSQSTHAVYKSSGFTSEAPGSFTLNQQVCGNPTCGINMELSAYTPGKVNGYTTVAFGLVDWGGNLDTQDSFYDSDSGVLGIRFEPYSANGVNFNGAQPCFITFTK